MSAPSYRFFTPKRANTFRAMAARLLPPDSCWPGGDDERLLQAADGILSARPERDRRDLRRFLGMMEVLPWLRYGRPFSRLSGDERDAVLRFFEHNRVTKLRQGLMGVKIFTLMAYYTDPAHFDEIGYPGPRMDAPYFQPDAATHRGAGPGVGVGGSAA